MRDTYWFQHTPESRERARQAVERAREGEFVRCKLEVQCDNQTSVVDFSLRSIADYDSVSYIVAVGRDITELGDLPPPAVISWTAKSLSNGPG
jgi:hypothetical protein